MINLMHLILSSLLFINLSAHAEEGPAWYKRKKEVIEQKKKEAEEKASEKPVDPNSTAEISENKTPPPDQNYLFKSEGHTDAFGIDFGMLTQPVISGNIMHLQYGMGWWWKPNLVFSGIGRLGGMLSETFVFMMVSIGPELRWFITQHWMVATNISLQYSQGLTRVPQAHIPPPPNPDHLDARYGVSGTANVAYMFWPNRKLGIGPIIGATYGFQRERQYLNLTLGITFQSGRPDYNGDLTSTW
jgi:hypothetical protein